jgi:predicted nucleic acid-binding protein
MPAVISDASVLIGLGAVGLLGLLRDFYSELFVPPAVWLEVTGAGARPGAAEVRMAREEGWLWVRTPAPSSALRNLKRDLDDGEAEAIALALEFSESLLLIDEFDARAAALRLGLDFTGTIGVLLRARKEGKIPSLKPILRKLIEDHRFRISGQLYQKILQEVGEV